VQGGGQAGQARADHDHVVGLARDAAHVASSTPVTRLFTRIFDPLMCLDHAPFRRGASSRSTLAGLIAHDAGVAN
jgi:hypothetical protein